MGRCAIGARLKQRSTYYCVSQVPHSWVIRDNVFRNIRPPAGVFGGTTIRMWNYSSNTLIERNAFFNCQYGVALGLDPSRPERSLVI